MALLIGFATVNLSLRAIAIPLICGNTVILRASENSPASQRIVVDLLVEVRTHGSNLCSWD